MSTCIPEPTSTSSTSTMGTHHLTLYLLGDIAVNDEATFFDLQGNVKKFLDHQMQARIGTLSWRTNATSGVALGKDLVKPSCILGMHYALILWLTLMYQSIPSITIPPGNPREVIQAKGSGSGSRSTFVMLMLAGCSKTKSIPRVTIPPPGNPGANFQNLSKSNSPRRKSSVKLLVFFNYPRKSYFCKGFLSLTLEFLAIQPYLRLAR